jgi:hypothetical protein
VLCCVPWHAAPFSDIYRGMALIGVKGFGALPKHCGTLMLAFFVAGETCCRAVLWQVLSWGIRGFCLAYLWQVCVGEGGGA